MLHNVTAGLRRSFFGGSLRAFGLNPPLIDAGIFPQLTRDLNGIDAGCPPQTALVAGAMDRAMMDTAERHGELIAGLAAERARLQVPQMVRVAWLAPADQAGLLGEQIEGAPGCGNAVVRQPRGGSCRCPSLALR